MGLQMSKKIEAKKIIIILAGIVVLSLLGIVAYSKLSPTGFVTMEAGTVALQVGEVVALTVIDNSTNLSLHVSDTAGDASGYVDPTSPNGVAWLSSDGCGADPTGFTCNPNGWWKNVSDGAPRNVSGDWILINNTGTVNLSVKLYSSSDAQDFFGAGNLEAFFVKANDNLGAGSACRTESATWIAYGEECGTGDNASDTVICSDFNNLDGEDGLNLTFNWTIPSGAAAGNFNSSLSIIAVKASG